MTVLNLLDHLVLKHFGQHPERGRRLKLRTLTTLDDKNKPTTFAGMRYVERFGRAGKWEPNPIQLEAIVALEFVSRNMWAVHVSSELREQVEWWLINTCGPSAITPSIQGEAKWLRKRMKPITPKVAKEFSWGVKSRKQRKRRTPSRFNPRNMAIKER